MGAQILDGRSLAGQIKQELAAEVADFQARCRFLPRLAIVMAGEEAASGVYVRSILRTAGQIGLPAELVRLPADARAADLQATLAHLSADPQTSGIIVQMPLPSQLAGIPIAELIPPEKDVEGVAPANSGRLALGRTDGLVPNTPLGGITLLKRYGLPISGRDAVVVGRSNIVGKPMALLLLAEQATVTICHSWTVNLAAHTRRADILVTAVGRRGLVDGTMIKPGAVVVDFGTNATEHGLVGDVDFATAVEVAGWITPVPGGTGPMATVTLLMNTLKAARRAAGVRCDE